VPALALNRLHVRALAEVALSPADENSWTVDFATESAHQQRSVDYRCRVSTPVHWADKSKRMVNASAVERSYILAVRFG
jgi:hypothetical protein